MGAVVRGRVDAASRGLRHLNQQPTTFVLPDQAVDRLRAAAGTIIMDSPEFKRLVKDVGGSIIAAPPGTTRNPSKD
ncbi:hypothetical protein [Variovorax sp. GT1P44]|uniref:hypothetical protein n=1 Tax=Variovorax sp. GT1P44 TaxID=3443742 RepID=UPI003F47D9B1